MRLAAALLGLALVPAAGFAHWPYLAEEASTLPEGRTRSAAGVTRTLHQTEHLRGGRGVLWTYPEIEGTVGVGSRAEISLQYEVLWFDPEEAGHGRYDTGDLRLWTKVGLPPGWLDGFAFRFGAKLPNTSEVRGLGTDESDVFLSALYGFRAGDARIDLSLGLGILGNQTTNAAQDDVLTWGASARLPLGAGFEAGVEGAGRSGPFGLHRRRDLATLAVVFGRAFGPWRLDLAGRRGLRDAQGWGWAAGLTWER